MGRDYLEPRLADNAPNAGRPAQSKQPFLRFLAANTNSTALGGRKQPTTVIPTTGWLYAKDYRSCRLFFGGAAGITGGLSAKYQVHLYHAIGTSNFGNASGNMMYLPQLVAKGALVLGTATFGASAAVYGLMAASGDRVVDVITDTADYAGTWILTSTNNVNAFIDLPLQGAVGVRVETKGGGVTSGGQVASITAFGKLSDDTYRPYA